eukprot:SAG31_NODE_33069_length_348_cov_0.827309_1_plen_63_part_10
MLDAGGLWLECWRAYTFTPARSVLDAGGLGRHAVQRWRRPFSSSRCGALLLLRLLTSPPRSRP